MAGEFTKMKQWEKDYNSYLKTATNYASALKALPFEVEQDGITLDDFAKQHNTTAAALKQLNADLPADGTLKKGTVIFVPAE